MSYDNLSPALTAALQAVGSPPITSGYRSPAHNAKVGGAKGSMHTHGKAADIDMSGMPDAQRAQLVNDLRAQGVLRFGTYTKSPNMLHVDLSDAQGGFHQMHDRTQANMANASGWFQELSGSTVPASAIGAGPAYQGGSIVPVSASLPQGAQDMQGLLPSQGGGLLGSDFTQQLAANPMLQMGLGIMATDNLGAGAMLGIQRANQASNAQKAFQLELAKTMGGGGQDLTAMEKQLQAAGFAPGTPEYQAMMLRLLTQPKSQVTVNTGDVGAPPAGMVFVNGKNAKDGMYPVDANNRPIGSVTYLPGTDPASNEEVKREGQIGLEGRLIGNLTDFAAKPIADKLFNLSGKVAEFASADTWTGAALRSTLDALPSEVLQTAGLDLDDPEVAAAMGEIAELRNTTINRISGAAVTEDEAKRIKAQLPSIGQSRSLFMANLERTRANNAYLTELQKARQNEANVGQVAAPVSRAAPTSKGISPEAQRLLDKWK